MKSLLPAFWLMVVAAWAYTSATEARAQSVYSPYTFTNFAGLATGRGSADGTGSAARFNESEGVAVDGAGNVYVADSNNDTIRKITPAGEVVTLAGSAGQVGSADGTGSDARFNYPTGVAVDTAGHVYVADQANHTIRQITPAGAVTTFAGSAGEPGSTDGTGSAARFNGPSGVAVDSGGTLYVGDQGNHTIRKITPTGEVTTLAGSAGQPGSADGDAGNARFNGPFGVAVDSGGYVYVADLQNQTIRKITPAGTVTTLAGSAGQIGSADGSGNTARFNSPFGVAVDSAANVYVTDALNDTIRKITASAVVTTFAGSAGQPGSADGTGSAARFNGPAGVAADSGTTNVYIADFFNFTIRKISPARAVTTLAGSAGGPGSADGTGSAAQFNFPRGVAVDGATNVYVADQHNHTIRKITAAGAVTTVAGSPGQSGSANGTGTAARFNNPTGIAVDSAGNIFVADTFNYTIRKITPTRAVSTFAGSAGQSGSTDGVGSAARFYYPAGLALDTAGNLYVADENNFTIRKITPAGAVTTLAGSAGQRGYTDGSGNAARFNDTIGVAVDSATNVYVADYGGSTIRKIAPTRLVTTLAGSPLNAGSMDGTGTAARFNGPAGVAADSLGNVYVGDNGNSTIRKITPAGAVTTLAGTPGQTGYTDGRGSAARFNGPAELAVDSAGSLYVADSGNNRITTGTPIPFRFDTSAGSLVVSNGFFQMRLSGPPGATAIVDASADFQAWMPFQTNVLPEDGLDLPVPLATNLNQFFRARLAP